MAQKHCFLEQLPAGVLGSLPTAVLVIRGEPSGRRYSGLTTLSTLSVLGCRVRDKLWPAQVPFVAPPGAASPAHFYLAPAQVAEFRVALGRGAPMGCLPASGSLKGHLNTS